MKISKLSYGNHLKYLVNRFRSRLQSSLAAYYVRFIRKNDVTVTGAYYSQNLGDFAMGSILVQAYKVNGRAVNHLSYDKLTNAGKLDVVVCGGGELGDESYFSRIFKSARNPQSVRIIGLSPYAKLHEAPEEFINDLEKIPYVSLRNRWAQKYLIELLDRDDIHYHPDLVFSFPKVFPEVYKRVVSKPKIITNKVTINIVPYGVDILKNGYFSTADTHQKMLAELYPEKADSFKKMHSNYLEYSRSLILKLISLGKKVSVVPFSLGDYLFADHFYSDLDVDIVRYSNDMESTLVLIRESDTFYTARFHAMIFGMLAQTEISPFCYSMKCSNLLADVFGASGAEVIDRDFLLSHDPIETSEKQLSSESFLLMNEQFDSISSSSHEAILSLIKHDA